MYGFQVGRHDTITYYTEGIGNSWLNVLLRILNTSIKTVLSVFSTENSDEDNVPV